MIDSPVRIRSSSPFILAIIAGMLLLPPAFAQQPPPDFSKAFVPHTIGPDSTSTLVFTIDNSFSAGGADNLAFTDDLPSGVTIASPAALANSCGGTVTAADGGTTMSLSDGRVGAGEICTVVVNVTAGLVNDEDITHTNTSGALTSDAGNSGPATDDLMVVTGLPGFTKSFEPSTVALGGRSTLTFTIDNSLGGANVASLNFTDTMPSGMVVASPSNATTDCEHDLIPAVLTAVPGTQVISLASNGQPSYPALAAGSTCTVEVDVIGGAVGELGNVSGELLVDFSESAGKASAVLTVTGAEDALELTKEFTDDPVAPGGSVALEFTVNNRSRTDSAAGIAFTDDLEATLTGLAPNAPLPPDPCGSGSALEFVSGQLVFTGGRLPPESSCTFGVTLGVPTDADTGTHPNEAGPLTGDVGGEAVTGNTAGDLLFVVSYPILTKEFTDDPVGAGGTVTLEFTITNPEDSSGMTDIAFVDELTTFLPTPLVVTLPPIPDPPCGAGSSLGVVPVGTDGQGLSLTGGSLSTAGSTGDSCTFAVIIHIPPGFPVGTYTNTTGEVTGELSGNVPVIGPPASEDLVVIGAPTLNKEFTDGPVLPGGSATLVFTLQHSEFSPGDATAIGFTDDLAAVLPGLAATGLPLTDVCGPGNGTLTSSSGDSLLTFSGATLVPGESCTFNVDLAVPGAAPPGFHINTTSEVTSTVGGVATTGSPASDDLLVTGLLFSKEFVGDPVIAGGEATLRFTLDNKSPSDDATGIFFTDDLSAVLPGLTAVGLPLSDLCGPGSSLTGTSFLIFDGGTVGAGQMCSFDVTLSLPPGTLDGTYPNVTSGLVATIGGSPATLGPAADRLLVQSALLGLTKEFTDDPAVPGGTTTLEFNLTNLDPVNTASSIALSDDLGAALSGLTFDSVQTNTCGGGVAGAGTSFVDFSGGSLAGGADCTIRLSLTLPPGPLPGGPFINTTSGVTGTILGLPVSGTPASDELVVNTLALSKSFEGPVDAGGTVDLMFTIGNLDAANPAVELSFSDDLDAVVPGLVATGLPLSDVCGAGSQLAGSSFLTLTGGNLPAGGGCSFDVVLQVPDVAAAGTYGNTTSDLFSSWLPVSPPALADLTVNSPGVDIVKTPDLQTIVSGGTADFTIQVTNTGDGELTNVVVSDPAAPDCSAALGALAQGAQTSYGCSLANVTADLTNTATVIADTPAGGQVTDGDSADVEVLPPTTCYTDDTATGTGPATFCFDTVDTGCDFIEIAFIAVEGDPQSPPPGTAPQGVEFPHGLVSFTLGEACPAGFTMSFSWQLPANLPPSTHFWKYGPTPGDPTPHWYVLPSVVDGDTVTFAVTDGGLGDDDLTANGTIVDQGGPGVPVGAPIPVVSPTSVVLLVVLLSLGGVAILRRRQV
jgi:uncharacterized repeat protein (TIGR01451 family)